MADTAIHLKVAEANPRDAGRGGIARVDPHVWAKRAIDDSGEAISLKGQRETVVKFMPTFPELRGRGIVRIDGIIREARLQDLSLRRQSIGKRGTDGENSICKQAMKSCSALADGWFASSLLTISDPLLQSLYLFLTTIRPNRGI